MIPGLGSPSPTLTTKSAAPTGQSAPEKSRRIGLLPAPLDTALQNQYSKASHFLPALLKPPPDHPQRTAARLPYKDRR